MILEFEVLEIFLHYFLILGKLGPREVMNSLRTHSNGIGKIINLENTTVVNITTVIFKPSFLRYVLALTVPKSYSSFSLCFQFKVRSILRPSQFGGQPCTEPLVTFQPCIPTKLCNIEEIDCKNKFRCDTGNVLTASTKNDLTKLKLFQLTPVKAVIEKSYHILNMGR